jgi:hypothetical protein
MTAPGSRRTLLERLGFGRRPPTGPLTTEEQATADELEARMEIEEDAEPDHEHGTETA